MNMHSWSACPSVRKVMRPVSSCLHTRTQWLHRLQATTDQLRRRCPATSHPPALAEDRPRPLHVPPSWTPAKGGKKGATEAKEPVARIETANDAARVEPRQKGYFNAVQVFPFSPGALYQIYAAPDRSPISRLSPVNSSRVRGRFRPAIPCAGWSATPKAEVARPAVSTSWSSRRGRRSRPISSSIPTGGPI